MSHSSSARPPISPNAGLENDPFFAHANKLNTALSYVEASGWILDPDQVQVEEPINQEQLLVALKSMFGGLMEGEAGAELVESNLNALRHQSSSDAPGLVRLIIKPGAVEESNALDDAPDIVKLAILSVSAVYRDWVQYRRERVVGTDLLYEPFIGSSSDIMVLGLIEATGATLLRDDLADGNRSGVRIYKGMLEGRPVYLKEHLQARLATCSLVRSRSLFALSEQGVRASLDQLSEKDKSILQSVGIRQSAAVPLPNSNTTSSNAVRLFTRSHMKEMIIAASI